MKLLSVACLLLYIPVFAQQIDEEYNSKIREYTTDERFLPASVLDLVDHPTIPSPLKHFGSIIGAPGVMHRTSEIYGYYEALATSSPRISIEQLGTSEEGRPIHLVIIANQDGMQRLDHYKHQLALLADPRQVQNVEAILQDSKPIFYLNGGMHSTEMNSPETLMELAYRLVTSEKPEIRNIRDNIITIINPVSEPDGRDKQVDWYYRYSKDRTEWDDGFRRGTPYWGKYIFHDNNRDGLQISSELTKAIFKAYFDYHPTVMLDLHESVPLIYMSTGTGPYNDTIDPITIGEWQVMANHDVTTLAAQGLPGAFTWAFYDGWWPGYGIWVANNHNSIGRFYETFGNAGGNTYLRDISRARYAGDPVTRREWYRPDPATAWVNWSSRNNVNYTEAGVLGSLTYTADNGRTLLQNFYQKGLNNIERGKNMSPRLYSIPSDQRDPAMAAYLVNQLRAQGIEIHQDQGGDFVILLDQPYRNLAVTLLSKQAYPKEAKFPPYDAIAWTMGYLYGVDVVASDSMDYDLQALTKLSDDVTYVGQVNGKGDEFVVPYKRQNSVLPMLYWLDEQGSSTRILNQKVIIKKDTLSEGSLLLGTLTSEQVETIQNRFNLDLVRYKDVPSDDIEEVTLPRVAIYHTWVRTQNEGWSRYTFDTRGVPYTSIDKDDLKQGNLNNRFDVILVPSAVSDAATFIHGNSTAFGPMPFTRTDEFPSHGTPDETDDMTGGPGFDGIANLQKFVDQGGTLVTLRASSKAIAEAGISGTLSPTSSGSLFHPGSVVTVKKRTNHPILNGYPEVFHIFRGNGPLLSVPRRDRDMMLLQYGTKPLKDEIPYTGEIMGLPENDQLKPGKDQKSSPYVLSGMVRNENNIIGHGSIFHVPVGDGNVVAFTFDPLHRYLNHHDAPLLWNALINWNRLR